MSLGRISSSVWEPATILYSGVKGRREHEKMGTSLFGVTFCQHHGSRITRYYMKPADTGVIEKKPWVDITKFILKCIPYGYSYGKNKRININS